ncbi:hypothetical protein L195_g018629 [Trifolium pratense]|uniref:Uncharacterized protein n=2 Tax=Trifolium pratense TaxID=57577 RepID=A0ACB0LSS1_TRIPR|nr:hypothetical protein L195_g018629 [Trifolium pratense]CAJ2670172.1 unnamed protein product [Trifolium pratense]
MADNMVVSFRSNIQRRRFEALRQREMTLHIVPDSHTMVALGISESVRFLIHQIGWESFAFSNLPIYRNLTLEFLSSFKYDPIYGKHLRRGLVSFRLFGNTYTYNHRDIAEFLGVPSGLDAITRVQNDSFMEGELKRYWGIITGNPNAAPNERFSSEIHNPAFRYFHMIIAHTFFGKAMNNTTVSQAELFMMFCVYQNRPINAATFLLTNFVRIIEEPTHPISIGGFVTFLARAIGLHTPLSKIVPLGGMQPMDLNLCFNYHMIGNLGPNEFQLLINLVPVHHFTLPNSLRISIHDKDNWLYDLEGQDGSDPETPPLYHYTPGPPSPPHPAASSTVPPTPADHGATIATLQTEIATLRTDFHNFMDLVIAQLDRLTQDILSLRRRFPPADAPPSG